MYIEECIKKSMSSVLVLREQNKVLFPIPQKNWGLSPIMRGTGERGMDVDNVHRDVVDTCTQYSAVQVCGIGRIARQAGAARIQ